MSANIVPFLAVQNRPEVLAEIREIFFESSTKKSFKDPAEKDAFFEKYLGFYLRSFPELVWIAQGARVLGYVVASPDSHGEELLRLQPHMQTFENLFIDYPAHLHINCHHESRGLGVGSKLIEAVIKALKEQNIVGLHIMTGPDSPNRAFYKKLGFDFESQLPFQGAPILFMGKRL